MEEVVVVVVVCSRLPLLPLGTWRQLSTTTRSSWAATGEGPSYLHSLCD
jgi:hypothetical protein